MAELKIQPSPNEIRKTLVGVCDMIISSLEVAKCRALAMSDDEIASEIEKFYRDNQEN